MTIKDHWHRMVHGSPGQATDNSTSDASSRTCSSEFSSARASSGKTPSSKPSSKASSKTSSQASASAHASFLASALRWRSRKPRLGDGLGDDGKKKKRSAAHDDEWLVAFRAYKIEFGATRPPRPSRDGDISPGTTRPPSLRETNEG